MVKEGGCISFIQYKLEGEPWVQAHCVSFCIPRAQNMGGMNEQVNEQV